MLKKRSVPIDIPIRTPATWTADERVTQCFQCRTDFSFLVRKHHCRVCGRIFCSDCSKFRIQVPSFVRHFIASSNGSLDSDTKKRVCGSCFGSTIVASRCRQEIYILANLPLQMEEFLELRKVNKRWNGAVKTLISLWNSIQYKLPHTKFTKLELALLRVRYNEIAGHSAWAVQSIKALQKVPHYKRIKDCSDLFCKKMCDNRLTVYELLELYTHRKRHDKQIDIWTTGSWAYVDIEDHIHLMPWWVHIFRNRPSMAINIFLKVIKDNVRAVYAFLFELKLQAYSLEYSETLNKILTESLKRIDKNIKHQWEQSNNFVTLLSKASCTDYVHRRRYIFAEFLLDETSVLCPWNPDITIQGISMEMQRLNTASKPLKISLYTDKGSMEILYKSEDVRKDKLTMDIAFWIQKNTNSLVTFTTYNVMPVTPKSGIIEMVSNATTLYDIKHKHNTTLQNFILDRNSNLTVVTLRKRFIKSVAAACVLSYVLGVGDRHLENMLVTDDGKLVHIDFSYLLGDDPKHVKSEMRITPDMLDALGGRNSQTFTEFQELCSDVYSNLRAKSSFWFSLFMYLADALPSIGMFGGDRFRIRQHVLERLCPGELDNEACMQIVEIVKKSSRDSWRVWSADKAHEFAKYSATMFQMDL